jgi:hypothetical protein
MTASGRVGEKRTSQTGVWKKQRVCPKISIDKIT